MGESFFLEEKVCVHECRVCVYKAPVFILKGLGGQLVHS